MKTLFNPAATARRQRNALRALLSALLLVSPAFAGEALPAADLQILLDRAGFSPGEIDGRAGGNTRGALAAFQSVTRLAPTGDINGVTEAALREAAGDEPLWHDYVLAEEDVRGPFVAVPDDMMEKSKLVALGYGSVAEAIAESFHVAPVLLAQINSNSQYVAGASIRVPNVRRAAAASAEGGASTALVEVSKSGTWITARDAAGRVIFYAPATSGSERDPLPLGDWKVKGVYRNPTFSYNPDLFWDADSAHSKAKLAAGPNNPVGLVWIDLNKEHYGLHGTAEPSKVGHAESHGCVRLTNWDALRLAALVAPETPVRFVP